MVHITDQHEVVRWWATNETLVDHSEDAARYLSELSPRIASAGIESADDVVLMDAAMVVRAIEVHSDSGEFSGYWAGYFIEPDAYPALLNEANEILADLRA